jgi:hypothetical protein
VRSALEQAPVDRHDLRLAEPLDFRRLVHREHHGVDVGEDLDRSRPRRDAGLRLRFGARELSDAELHSLDLRIAFKDSPMKRAKLRGLKRNAAVVLGSTGTSADVPSLAAALSDPEPLVRGHAAWALPRAGSPDAFDALRAWLPVESDEGVLAQLREELTRLSPTRRSGTF